jgi:Ca-activated chloride channel family protein
LLAVRGGLPINLRVLAEGEILGGDVVLITSGEGAGEGAGLGAAAARIAARGARLSLVSASAAPAPEPEPGRAAQITDLGGRIFAMGDIDPLSTFLQQNARTALERDAYPLLYWRDLGRYVLLLAAVPLLLLFRPARS